LLAVKHCQFFQTAALEIFDGFQIFFQFIGNGGLGLISMFISLEMVLFFTLNIRLLLVQFAKMRYNKINY